MPQHTGPAPGPALRRLCRVVVVNWNSGPRLIRCLDSIPAGFETVVVDNASSDALTFLERPGMQLIRNPSNLGFAAAANQGGEACTRKYLLFLNPDISFAEAGSADRMLELLERTPSAAAATGRLESPASSPLGRAKRSLIQPLPTVGSAVADVLFLDDLFGRAGAEEEEPVTEGPREIEQAPGACLMIRTEVFRKMGGFDVSFFPAWFEDVDLSRRLRDLGFQILLEPQSLFFHEGGYSLERLGRPHFNRIFYGNMVRYFRKHHGPVASGLVRTAVIFGNAGRRLRALFP